MSSIKTKALILAIIYFIMPVKESAAEPQIYYGAVMSAYQQAYAMNFEIYKPQGLPAGWYATFDGFPVAQIAENRWVYGQFNFDGAIRPTNVLVGSVVPSSVPGLLRINSSLNYGYRINSPEFQKIADYMCNRMGWLHEGEVDTLIAWNTSKPGVWIWLGDRWKRFIPRTGEYTWQMLKRLNPYILAQLRKNKIWYGGGEPLEAADFARQRGMIWGGRVLLESLKAYRDSDGGGRADTSTSMHETSSGGSESHNAPQENNNSGGQWDVD